MNLSKVRVVVPYEDREIEKENFKIENSWSSMTNKKRVYVIDANKEEILFLTLKYGSKNVIEY